MDRTKSLVKARNILFQLTDEEIKKFFKIFKSKELLEFPSDILIVTKEIVILIYFWNNDNQMYEKIDSLQIEQLYPSSEYIRTKNHHIIYFQDTFHEITIKNRKIILKSIVFPSSIRGHLILINYKEDIFTINLKNELILCKMENNTIIKLTSLSFNTNFAFYKIIEDYIFSLVYPTIIYKIVKNHAGEYLFEKNIIAHINNEGFIRFHAFNSNKILIRTEKAIYIQPLSDFNIYKRMELSSVSKIYVIDNNNFVADNILYSSIDDFNFENKGKWIDQGTLFGNQGSIYIQSREKGIALFRNKDNNREDIQNISYPIEDIYPVNLRSIEEEGLNIEIPVPINIKRIILDLCRPNNDPK